MQNELTNNLYIRVIEYCSRFPNGLKYYEVLDSEELKLDEIEKTIIARYLKGAEINYQAKQANVSANSETLFVVVSGDSRNSAENPLKFIINIDSHFKYIEYLELKLARKSAEESKRLSTFAIMISISAIIVSILIPLVTTQDVRITKEQIEDFHKIIDRNSAIIGK